MIERYTRPEMGAVWTDQARFGSWLETELAVCEARASRGEIPPEEMETIRTRAGFDTSRIAEVDAKVGHDVIAFLTSVAEQMASEMSEEQLLREIGLRARTFAMYPAAASSVKRSVPEAAALERAWDDLSEFGSWIFRRLNRQLYSVPTGDRRDDDDIHPLNGFDRTNSVAASSIVSVLTATLGVAPAIASVVTALALKRLLKPGWDETYARQPQLVTDVQ